MAARDRIDPLEGSSRSLFFGARPEVPQVTEPLSEEAQNWSASFIRVDAPEGVSGFEQRDETGEIIGRVWCKATIKVDSVE